MTILERGKKLLADCLAVQPCEQVLIVTDDGKASIGQALYQAAEALGAAALLMQMQPCLMPGQ